jgi:hypothetical protein
MSSMWKWFYKQSFVHILVIFLRIEIVSKALKARENDPEMTR